MMIGPRGGGLRAGRMGSGGPICVPDENGPDRSSRRAKMPLFDPYKCKTAGVLGVFERQARYFMIFRPCRNDKKISININRYHKTNINYKYILWITGHDRPASGHEAAISANGAGRIAPARLNESVRVGELFGRC